MSTSWRDYVGAEAEKSPPLTPAITNPKTFGAIGGEKPTNRNEHKLAPLTAEQSWAVGHWLNTIQEHEPEHRETVHKQCNSDPFARVWYLLKAERMQKENRRTCLQCRRWRGETCTSQAADRARTDPPKELGKCLDYCPRGGDPDLRQGLARWPGLLI